MADRHRDAVVVDLRPPAWDWSFVEDGNLALDRHELWEEPPSTSARDLSQSPPPRRTLKELMSFATVPPMPPPRAPGSPRADRRSSARRIQRFAGLALVSVALVVTLLLTAFGSGSPGRADDVRAAVPVRTGASGLPLPQVIATQGPVRLQMPVAQSRVTAIGYHRAGNGALRLEPLGRRGNEGLLGRLIAGIFGTVDTGLVWYQLDGGSGPATSALDIGAAPETDVFSPVDGTVVGIADLVLDRKRHGVRIDIQPANAPSLVVSLSRVEADPALTVGSAVAATKTRLGTVIDLSAVERQALARYTQDAGNHVSIEVRPAATLSLP